jgi:hypothetical protein
MAADVNGPERDVVPWSSLGFTDVYNDAGPISFDVSKHSKACNPSLLAPTKTELHLYRGGLFVWGGYLWHARPSLDASTVAFAGSSYYSRLGRREVKADLNFEDEDQLDIAWGLIDYTQGRTGGELGITRANPAESSGVLRTIDYLASERSKIAEAIKTLAGGVDGFDFAIVPRRDAAGVIYREWTAYYPQKGEQSAALISLGKNVDAYSLDLDGLDVTSERTGTGSGTGSSVLSALSSDAGALAEFGLLEDSTSYSDVTDEDLLQELTDEDQANHNTPPATLTVEVRPDDVDAGFEAFEVGDTVRVRILDGFYVDSDVYRRVASKAIAVTAAGRETMTVAFDKEG